MTEIIYNQHRPPGDGLKLARISSAAGYFEAISEFVSRFPAADLQPVTALHAPIAYQSRVLLALLTFFYAQRFYTSSEIETALRSNPSLRALCGQEYPSAALLRRFRRHNRDALRECLAYTLARVQGEPREAQEPRDRGPRAAARFAYLEEAERHIEEAILRDTVDLDD